MRVLERAVYRGPNLFSDIPMVRIQLDLGSLKAFPSNQLTGFNDRLLELLPSLSTHACSRGHAGGFVERLREGTWLGHVAEHVAIELQSLAGVPVEKGKTRSVKGRRGIYNVLFQYRDEPVGLLAGRLALELVASLAPEPYNRVRGLDIITRDALDGPFDLKAALDLLKRTKRRTGLGPTTGSIVEEAERRGIPVMRLDEQSLVQLGWGARQQRIRASITGRTAFLGVETASDKDLTKTLLARAGVPTPSGVVVRSADDAVREAARLGGPVVVKPLDGNHGRGVSVDLTEPEAIRAAFATAAEHSRRVVVEQFFTGNDHRLLVVGGELVAVAERIPAHVAGDGESSIRSLVEQVNRDPRRGEGHEQVLTRIRLDRAVNAFLAKQNMTMNHVPMRRRGGSETRRSPGAGSMRTICPAGCPPPVKARASADAYWAPA